MLAAVTQNGLALYYASAEMKAADTEVVLAAVAEAGCALRFAGAKMKSDPVIVFTAVMQSGHALEFASVEMKNDHGIIIAAVSQSGGALRHASEKRQRQYMYVTDRAKFTARAEARPKMNVTVAELTGTTHSVALRAWSTVAELKVMVCAASDRALRVERLQLLLE